VNSHWGTVASHNKNEPTMSILSTLSPLSVSSTIFAGLAALARSAWMATARTPSPELSRSLA